MTQHHTANNVQSGTDDDESPQDPINIERENRIVGTAIFYVCTSSHIGEDVMQFFMNPLCNIWTVNWVSYGIY